MSKKIDVFIGLEIHVQLLTQSKMFCPCPARFEQQPNVNVCPTCLGYPGTLPVPNEQAVSYAYALARALHCNLAAVVQFDRKHYFYPDLAKNYQISQFHNPIGTKGRFDFFDGTADSSVGITQAHLEEDAGKLVHMSDATLCDYNRAGTPLMEVVTAPEIRTPEQAEHLLRQFRRLVRYLGVCDGNMEEGSLRCDANISVNEAGKGLGSKVEIKNLNSFKFVRLALEHEIARQTEVFTSGGTIAQETRLWNENRGLTTAMRSKERADDYRYFPEPDIAGVKMPKEFFASLEAASIELPFERAARMKREYKLSDAEIAFLIEEKNIADFFEQTIALGAQPSQVASWCMSDVQKLLNRHKIEFGQPPLTPKRFAWMLASLESGTIHGKLAKQILEKVFAENKDPQEIIASLDLVSVSGNELASVVSEFLAAQPQAVQQYKDGNKKLLGFFMGEIMKKTKGAADPAHLTQLLKESLDRS